VLGDELQHVFVIDIGISSCIQIWDAARTAHVKSVWKWNKNRYFKPSMVCSSLGLHWNSV